MSHNSGRHIAWHQRLAPVRITRAWARARFFSALRAAGRTDDGRSIAREAIDDLAAWRLQLPARATSVRPPYPELGRASAEDVAALRQPVFISARFRSGSTLLWNLFRHVDGCTSYYEPLNERRWFDPAHRGERVDTTHLHVEDYWREYDGLDELAAYYREEWINRRLYMDERSWDPDLAAYIRTMVRRAEGRPVLQFNRVDFRLPWLRHTFPTARIVHLYRNPRDQWFSSLWKWKCPLSCTAAEFAQHDHFYLLSWAEDLKHRFPFLDPSTAEHPYRVFYYLWKLSFWFGAAYAHHSVSFEELTSNPRREIERLFHAVGIEGADYQRLETLVEATPSRWQKYAPDDWFRAHEEACENVLRDFFGIASSTGHAESPLRAVRSGVGRA